MSLFLLLWNAERDPGHEKENATLIFYRGH